MKKFDRTRTIYISLAAFLAAIFLFFSWSRVFDEFEYSTLDFRYKIRPLQPVDKNIAIIEIGDDSIAKIGKWPFPRNYHALLIKALESAGARTIVFDVFFSEKSKEDKALADTIKEVGNVYIPYVFELDRDSRDKSRTYATGYAAGMIDELKAAVEGAGFVNVVPDGDGKVRRVPMFIEYNGEKYPQLTFLVALENLGYSFEDADIKPGKSITVGENIVIPLGEDSSMLVDYPDEWGRAFRHYSYVDIIQSYLADITGQEPSVDLGQLKDSICFIGMTAAASPDAHPSPMEPMYPGIGVHTSVYNSIIKNVYLKRMDRWLNMLILVVMWILTAYVTTKSRKRFAIISIILLMGAYVCAAALLFWPGGIWVDVFYPVVSMVAIYIIFTFKKYVTETQKRELMEKELNIAKDIQQSFLPREIPKVGTLDIHAKMITAKQVGGDLYDIVELGGGKLGIMLGDVSGKGFPAALYMAKAVSVFRTYINEGSPAQVLKRVNERLVSESATNLFVTLTYMVFDTVKGKAVFAIGGHMPTVLIEPDGEVKLLDVSEGMPLGMIECDFGEAECDLKPGSIFVLYTDGVTEAMDQRDDMFLERRLVELCKKLKGKPPEEVVEAIHKAVADFAGKAPQHDDITVMAIRV